MFEHTCHRCGLTFETENEIEDLCPDCLDELANENVAIGEEKEMQELEYDS